jgi:hypothetical protein
MIGTMVFGAISLEIRRAAATPPDVPSKVVISIADVERFYKVYDAANGNPTAEELQRDYIDPGSPGLQASRQNSKRHRRDDR